MRQEAARGRARGLQWGASGSLHLPTLPHLLLFLRDLLIEVLLGIPNPDHRGLEESGHLSGSEGRNLR